MAKAGRQVRVKMQEMYRTKYSSIKKEAHEIHGLSFFAG
jgi:hypothetical protein